MDKQQSLNLIRKATGNQDADFRDGQWEAIDALVNQRKKLLVVQRTGWGKSAVYFITTRILRDQGYGLTIIISPLLALMRNQIESAKKLGIRAISINASNIKESQKLAEQAVTGNADCLLISPERLSDENFMTHVIEPIADRIGLFVIDEAHCISDWGHDFRPDYRRLLNILRYMPPNTPILTTTATANDRVIQDIVQQVGNIEVSRGSLVRESLALQNITLKDQASRLAWLAMMIPQFEGAGIIYVLTKRDAKQVSSWLCEQGIEANAYYSKITHPDFEDTYHYREHLEDLLFNNQLKVLVATTALGMGYDKPDLSFVIHYQAPSSIISYYQQVGRAGRGIAESFGFLLAGAEDDDIHEYFRSNAFPNEQQVNLILSALEKSDGLSSHDLYGKLNMRETRIDQVLKYLCVENPAPLIKERTKYIRTSVAYQLDQEKIARLTNQREEEWREIREYINTKGCLMEFLRNSLDDPEPSMCGKCSNCLGESLLNQTVDQNIRIAAVRFLKRGSPIEAAKQIKHPGAFTEYKFPFRLPENIRAEEGRTLSRWGDAVWGTMVQEDKHTGEFRDELVVAAAEMIVKRWKPSPALTWVTCVPSLTQPQLVSSFAAKLAESINLPFFPVICKVKMNKRQKTQENRFYQYRNLDGVFEIDKELIDKELLGSPVLLVDDVTDSGITFTVLAALLRRQGSGPVFPFALSSSKPGG